MIASVIYRFIDIYLIRHYNRNIGSCAHVIGDCPVYFMYAFLMHSNQFIHTNIWLVYIFKSGSVKMQCTADTANCSVALKFLNHHYR